MRSSIGFHTMELARWLIPYFKDTNTLLDDFKRYSQRTGNLQIYTDEKNLDIIIKYCRRRRGDVKDIGMKWRIKRNLYDNDLGQIDILYVEINPKILAGVHDYITAATYDDMRAAVDNFNRISESISPLLGVFDEYRLHRIDYCFNISVSDLYTSCTAEQVMELIKRSDVPWRFEEWKNYDQKSHRMRTGADSFYLVNKSVHINCYSKHADLEKRMKQHSNGKHNDISQLTLEKSRDIIRFEVQCLSKKAKVLTRDVWNKDSYLIAPWEDVLMPKFCSKVLLYYYEKTIGCNRWYTLDAATSMVKAKGYNSQKEARILEVLKAINQCRSVAIAKQEYANKNRLNAFCSTIRDLSILCINPVTIPRSWGVKSVKNPYHLLQHFHMNSK